MYSMKKTIIFILLITAAFTACKKDDKSLFDQTPDQRLNQTLDAYQSQISGAANGWKGFITVDSGRGSTYSFYFKFSPTNRVTMYADFDSSTAVTPIESSYRIKALQQPSLIFDTYSYVHLLADPTPSVNGGPTGAGLISDFEFAFESASTDTIKLIGRFNGSKAILIRATPQEATAYNNRQLGNSLLLRNLGKYLNYFKRVTIGGITYQISANIATRTITFSWVDSSGNLKTFTTNYYYTVNGVEFSSPFTNGSQTITGLRNITWDAATTTLGFSVNGTATTVVGLGQPLKVDLDAPRRFKQYAISNGDLWISYLDWHINGVDDALRLTTLIPNYAAAIYSPVEVGAFGWTQGDLAGILYNGGNAGRLSSYISTINNGIIKFSIQGTNASIGFGTALTTAQSNLIVGATNSFRSLMTDPTGYYLVQTGPASFDMVSALDGKTWISWKM